ncbi:YdcF family protein [Patescibacteria group bacterium]
MPIIRSVAIVFYIFCLILIFIIGFTPLNEWISVPLTHEDKLQNADVIIVLGSGLHDNGSLTPNGQERVLQGAILLEQSYGSMMLMSGGQYENTSYYESEQMSLHAQSLGVPETYIITERESTSTYENALFSKEIMAENMWEDALVVTSAFHSKRACNVFKAQNISVTCIPADPDLVPRISLIDRLVDFWSIMREYGATMYYSMKGYI